ncbi:MAG: hypothetical protein KBA06_01240 [Saprospiraceae bacterium]|nr:hypothetical protein [Saprospiraceae bacterium]
MIERQKDNLLGIIKTLYPWKKQILFLVLITSIGTAIITFFLPNYYRSTTIFYAASPDLAKPDMLFGTTSQSMQYYGSSEDIDRIITISNSGDLNNFLIDSFKLYEHYDIDKSKSNAHIKVNKNLLKHLSIQKNKYDAIELSFEDKDKVFATKLCNAARNKIDDIARYLIKSSQSKIINTYESSINTQEKQLKSWADSLQMFRTEYGIYDAKSQSEILSTLIATAESSLANDKAKLEIFQKSGGPRDSIIIIRARISGLQSQLKSLTTNDGTSTMNIQKFNEGLGRVDLYNELYDAASMQLGEERQRYEQIKSSYNSYFPAVHVVEEAAVPIEKSRPVRSVIVLVAALMSLIFSVLAILLIESYKDVNWKEVFHD